MLERWLGARAGRRRAADAGRGRTRSTRSSTRRACACSASTTRRSSTSSIELFVESTPPLLERAARRRRARRRRGRPPRRAQAQGLLPEHRRGLHGEALQDARDRASGDAPRRRCPSSTPRSAPTEAAIRRALAVIVLARRRVRGCGDLRPRCTPAARAARSAAAAGARARYEALAAHLPDVSVLLYDRDLRFTLLEGAGPRAHGWRREDIEGRLIAEACPPAGVDELLEHCQAALRGESSEPRLGRACATERAATAATHVPLRDARGAVIGGMIVVRDITAAERLQRERRASAGSCPACSSSSPITSWRATPTAGCCRHAAAPQAGAGRPLDWPEHFGLRRPDGRTPLPAAEVPLFRALHGEVVERRRAGRSGRPGERPAAPASLRAARCVDAAGAQLGAVCVGRRRHRPARDRGPPARQRGALPLGRRERRRQRLPDRPAGRWTFLNESWTRWTGYPVEDGARPPGLRARASRATVPATRARSRRCSRGERDSVLLRHRYLTAEGVTRWAEVRARRWHATPPAGRSASPA